MSDKARPDDAIQKLHAAQKAAADLALEKLQTCGELLAQSPVEREQLLSMDVFYPLLRSPIIAETITNRIGATGTSGIRQAGR